MTVWVEYSINELMDVQNGYAFKSGEYIEEGSNTFEVLKMGHIEKGGGLRKSPKKDYVPRTEKLGRWVLSKDDIVMAMTDMKDNVVILGVPARIDRSDHYVLNQRVARLTLKNPNLVDIGFIYSYLKWEDFLFELQSKASSGVQVNLSTSTIKESILRVPPLPEQKAIAAVLSSLDDKIDLLHRQNKTLEAMAASLYRQWFVEEAQVDWEVVKLGDFFPVVTGKKDANFSTDDGEYPFFTCSQAAIKAPSFSFDGAAILLSGNGDFNVKRYIGKFEAYQRTYVLIPYDEKYFSFLFTLMRYYLSDITGGHQGSVINFITKGMITDFTFSMPKERGLISKKLEQFNEIYEKVDSNTKQIRTLEKLRDNLLPKLMRGEVRMVY